MGTKARGDDTVRLEMSNVLILNPTRLINRWTAAVLRRRLTPLVLLLVIAGSAPLAARAQTPVGPDAPLPSPVGYVNDFANVLPAETRARLEGLAQRVNVATRGDMVIVTLPDLGGRPVEEVSLRLGREWKLGADAAVGEAARNAGVVILIVPKETASDGRGRCRIETGQGAEGFITDATSGAICRAVTQQFVAKDYGGAIEQIAITVADRYAAEFGVNLDGSQRPQERARERSQPRGGIPFWLIILLFIVLPMILSRGRGRGRGGCVGCIPIPFGGFGGGGFGGGGFSGGGFGGGFGGGGGGGGFGGFGGGGGFSGGGGGSDW